MIARMIYTLTLQHIQTSLYPIATANQKWHTQYPIATTNQKGHTQYTQWYSLWQYSLSHHCRSCDDGCLHSELVQYVQSMSLLVYPHWSIPVCVNTVIWFKGHTLNYTVPCSQTTAIFIHGNRKGSGYIPYNRIQEFWAAFFGDKRCLISGTINHNMV